MASHEFHGVGDLLHPAVAPPPALGSNMVGSLVHASTSNASLSAAPMPGSAAFSSSANTYIMREGRWR